MFRIQKHYLFSLVFWFLKNNVRLNKFSLMIISIICLSPLDEYLKPKKQYRIEH